MQSSNGDRLVIPVTIDDLAANGLLEESHGGARLTQLLARLGTGTFRFPKVHSSEISKALLETLGFRPTGGHLLFAARARSE